MAPFSPREPNDMLGDNSISLGGDLERLAKPRNGLLIRPQRLLEKLFGQILGSVLGSRIKVF
jgi:hypothetical protein